MKKIIVILTFVLFTTLVWAGAEKGEEDLEKGMKAAGGNMSSLRKNVEAKNKTEIIRAAKEMEKIFKQSKKFFAKQKMEDGVKWSQDAKDAAKALANAAKKDDAENVASSMKALGATCQACHGAHREKLPDGKYKLK